MARKNEKSYQLKNEVIEIVKHAVERGYQTESSGARRYIKMAKWVGNYFGVMKDRGENLYFTPQEMVKVRNNLKELGIYERYTAERYEKRRMHK